MRRLSAVLALLLIYSILQAQTNAGAGDPNAPAVTALTVKQQDPPQQVNNAAVQAIRAGGFRTLYYWIVSHSTVGVSAPAGPFVLNGGPNNISSSAKVTINWFPAPGVTSYDVLRTRTDDAPTGACNCAVATGVTTITATDQSETLQAYTVSVFDTSSSGITLTNESYSPGVTALTARYKGQFMWQVRSDGSERRAGNYEVDGAFKAGSVGASATVTGILNGSRYNASACGVTNRPAWCAGSDLGAWINAAVAACAGKKCTVTWAPESCGTAITPINVTDAIGVSFEGPGSASCALPFTAAGDALQVTTTAEGFAVTQAGKYSGFTIDGTGNTHAKASGIHLGDIIGVQFDDVVVKNFTGTGQSCQWFDNRHHWTERTTSNRLALRNCSTLRKYTVNGGDASFGYNRNFDLRLNLTGTNEVGVRSENNAYVYNGFLGGVANVESNTAKVFSVAGTSQIAGITFALSGECSNGAHQPKV